MDADEGDKPCDPGRLLIIGGAECRGSGLLERFVELSGGEAARIVLVTTATGAPEEVHADYERVFRKLGVDHTRELRLRGRSDADGDNAAKLLDDATGVFFSGGDQSRLRALVGSRANEILRGRLRAGGAVIAGTSAGATVMGRTMILGGEGPGVSAATVRTGPGLGLLPKALIIDMHFSERGRPPAAQRHGARPGVSGRRHRREHRDPGRRHPLRGARHRRGHGG
jgi:cyanophycinase